MPSQTRLHRPKQQQHPHNLAHIYRDRGYRFQDRDPQMEALCDLIDKSGLSVYQISQKVASMTKGVYRVAESTIDNWLSGKTRRPTHFTMMWVAAALGYSSQWVKID